MLHLNANVFVSHGVNWVAVALFISSKSSIGPVLSVCEINHDQSNQYNAIRSAPKI